MSDRDLPRGYEPRSIRLLKVWRPVDWAIKVYGISNQEGGPAKDLLEAALDLALQQFPRPAVTDHRYGVGLLVVQEGEDANYVRVGWWTRKYLLKSHLYRSDPGGKDPDRFFDVTSTGLTATLWELPVLNFERMAWIKSVLDRQYSASLDEYVLRKFDARE